MTRSRDLQDPNATRPSSTGVDNRTTLIDQPGAPLNGPLGDVPVDKRRWQGGKPSTWSENRKEAMRAVSKSVRKKRVQPTARETWTGEWLEQQLAAGAVHLFPLTERPYARSTLPPGAKWHMTLWHKEALRVFVTGQFACKREAGGIIGQKVLARILGCGRSKAGVLMRDLVRWNMLESHARSRLQPGELVKRWRTENRYVVTPFAVAYYDIRGRKSRRTITGVNDPDAVVSIAPIATPKPAPIPSTNPDGTPVANRQVGKQPAKRSSLREERSEDCERRAGLKASASRTSISEATPPNAAPQPSAKRVNSRPATPLASDEAGRATSLLDSRPRVDAKLQPPVPLRARRDDDDDTADFLEAAMRRFGGDLTPAEKAALERLSPSRRGGAS